MTHTNTTARARFAAGITLILAGAILSPMSGCRGDRSDKPPHQFFPDMDDQPKIKAQSQSKFFADGEGQRPHMPGTVPYGDNTFHAEGDTPAWADEMVKSQADSLKGDESYYFGLVAGTTDQYVQRMPVEVTKELLARGQERYDIYCSMCHGYDAKGGDSGSVGRLWSIPPANLTDPKYMDRTGEFGADGYIFHVIREGLWTPTGDLRMPSYKHAVTEEDAWAIISYIRALQAAQTETSGGEG